tara:strand:+ start:2400 stop:2684 length:285 start_codon:yes stop_codon:yes gene_type:complete
MAFKMKNPSLMKMAKEAGSAMKMKEPMKMKKAAPMKAAKPDFPDIDGDGNTTESMKQAGQDMNSVKKMKKEEPMKMKKEEPMKMKKGAMKMKKK